MRTLTLLATAALAGLVVSAPVSQAAEQPTFVPQYTFDCNDNGISDSQEISNDKTLDLNSDGVLDQCEPVGDLNDDGVVDVSDLMSMLSSWGAVTNATHIADLNGDQAVDHADLSLLISNWS